jgi:hypothetical protein
MTARKQQILLAMGAFILVSAFTGVLLTQSPKAERPQQQPTEQRVPPKPKLTRTVASNLSPSNTYFGDSGWSAGKNAHAESFVPDASGKLSTIEIAIEPSYVRKGREKTAGDLDLCLAQDQNGLPGLVLERFSFTADAPSSPPFALSLILESAEQPPLQAGAKYWLCAGCLGPGSWLWRFNDQNLTRVSAREEEPGKWTSAGNGRNGAFRVIVAVEVESVP